MKEGIPKKNNAIFVPGVPDTFGHQLGISLETEASGVQLLRSEEKFPRRKYIHLFHRGSLRFNCNISGELTGNSAKNDKNG